MATSKEIQQWLINEIANLSAISPEEIDVKMPFINYGLESLEMISVTGDLEDWLSCRLPPNLLYDYSTIEELADHLQILTKTKKTKQETKTLVKKVSSKKLLPLSYRQEWLFLNQRNGLNIMFAIQFDETLDISSFNWAISEILKRHKNLRTGFVMDNKKPKQFVTTIEKFDIPVLQLESNELLPKIAAKTLREPFDITQPPLFRVLILQKDEQDFTILFLFHHLIFDGFSLWVFINELRKLYSDSTAKKNQPLQALEFQYTDYVSWQREALSGDILNQHLQYWRDKLANIPEIFHNKKISMDKVITYNFVLAENERNLIAFSSKYNVTPFLILYTSFALLIKYYANRKEIIISLVDANRFPPMTKNLIGYFSNHIFLKNTIKSKQSFIDLLLEIKKEFIESCKHSVVPFGKMINFNDKSIFSHDEELAAKHGRILFNFIKTPETFVDPIIKKSRFLHGDDFPSETWEGGDASKHNDPKNFRYIYMRIISEASKLYGRIVYAKDLFTKEQAQNFITQYQRCINLAMLNPESKIDELLERIVGELSIPLSRLAGEG